MYPKGNDRTPGDPMCQKIVTNLTNDNLATPVLHYR